MLYRILIALCALCLPQALLAQTGSPQPAPPAGEASAEVHALAGTWDFRVDGTTIFRFEIEEGRGGEWHGRWQRPADFNTDGDAFSNMRGGVKTTDSMTGIEFLGMIELAFDDPRPGAVPDIFRFKLEGEDSAAMTYVGTELAPYALVRASSGAGIGDWDPARIYRRSASVEVPARSGRVLDDAPEELRGFALPSTGAAVQFDGGDDPVEDAASAQEQEQAAQSEDESPAPRVDSGFLDGL